MKTIPASELILNTDGSVFHLHLLPGQLADRVILVGDPARVDTVASYFDEPHVPIGTYVVAEKSIGFDGVLNFYAGRDSVSDLAFEKAFCDFVGWNRQWAAPYIVDADADLVARIAGYEMVRGITISANGFYAPQGRELRLPLADPDLNRKIEAFRYEGRMVTNYEMESSAVAGLSRLMGHKAMTVCCIIANRLSGKADAGYKGTVEGLIELVLQRI